MHHQWISPEWAMVILTTVYVCLTGFYAYVSHKTLKTIEQQAESNAKQFRLQLAEAKKSADAALAGAEAVMSAERARIVCSFNTSGSTSHYMTIRNCGRTPALLIDVKFIRKHVPITNDPHLPDSPNFGRATEFIHKRILCAGDKWEPQDYRVRVSAAELTEELCRRVESGQTRFYVYGRVEYRDVFRNDALHETRFCFFYSPPLHEFIIGGPSEYTQQT